MRWLRWLLAMGLLVFGGVLGAPGAPAAADAVSACSPSKGVLVVVDLRHFGGNITRGCAVSPSTGFVALHSAGFTTVGTQHDGPGFVCRIDGQPSSDPCYRTPPASAYWSYWHADSAQGGWSYSSKGAQASHPGDGSIDAWIFGATDIGGSHGGPSFTPAQVRSGTFTVRDPKPRSTPTHTPDATMRAPATSKPSGARSSGKPGIAGTAPVAGDSSAGRTATSSRSSATARSRAAIPSGTSAAPSTKPSTATSAPVIVDASAVSAPAGKKTAGSALPVIGGVALVLLLGGGAGWTALQRRRTDADL